MNKDKLNKVVIDVLGFNPEEIKYKQDELTAELAEIKEILKNSFPMFGQTIMEFHLMKEFLRLHNLDAGPFIENEVNRILEQNAEDLKDLKLESKRKV